jgi:hypothetical protein
MEITEKMYLKSKMIVDEYERQGKNGKNHIELRDTDLPFRVNETLRNFGLYTIGDVRKFFDEKGIYGFCRIHYIGKRSLENIRELLEITYEDFYK